MSEEKEDITIRPESAVEIVSSAVLRASMQMGLKGTQLARIIGISPATVSRMNSGSHTLTHASKPYELALLLLRIHRALSLIMGGDRDSLQMWMTTHNEDLGDIPARKILSVHGLINVLGYVEMRAAAA